MKKIHYLYWTLAIIGFILPISRVILIQFPTSFSAFFVYLFSLGFKTKVAVSLTEVLVVFLSGVSLFGYIYQLLALSVEINKTTKIGYIVAVLMYSSIGSFYLSMQHPQTFGYGLAYFIVLSSSSFFLIREKA